VNERREEKLVRRKREGVREKVKEREREQKLKRERKRVGGRESTCRQQCGQPVYEPFHVLDAFRLCRSELLCPCTNLTQHVLTHYLLLTWGNKEGEKVVR
jgi:hypothetical protein